jgi:hypothetical protein
MNVIVMNGQILLANTIAPTSQLNDFVDHACTLRKAIGFA